MEGVWGFEYQFYWWLLRECVVLIISSIGGYGVSWGVLSISSIGGYGGSVGF